MKNLTWMSELKFQMEIKKELKTQYRLLIYKNYSSFFFQALNDLASIIVVLVWDR